LSAPRAEESSNSPRSDGKIAVQYHPV